MVEERNFHEICTAGIIQLTEEFEFPAKTVLANNSMIIDLRLNIRSYYYNHMNFDPKVSQK